MYCDASFADDAENRKSTSANIMFLMGPRTCVPISWMCKKQGAVSHSSTEAETIALDAAVRMDGLPSLQLWDEAISVFGNGQQATWDKETKPKAKRKHGTATVNDALDQFIESIDHVPKNIVLPKGKAKLYLLEDNESVIKISLKKRWPQFRHVSRTHQVDLQFLYCLLYTSPSPRDKRQSRMPSSA